MALDLHRLRKLKAIGNGYRAQCLACLEAGHDRCGEHLRIFPDGRWGCALYPADHEHRKRIWQLAHGDKTTPGPAWKPPEKTCPAPDWQRMLVQWESQTEENRLVDFAGNLGVSPDSLHALGCCWASNHKAFAFPMRNAAGDVVGVRLRNEFGRKWSVNGSRSGLFWNAICEKTTPWICEGCTDAAAALTIGLWCIGRSSCNGDAHHLRALLHRQSTVILADNDKPGLDGARKLAAELAGPTTILILPAKDLRDFVKAGGTRQLIECLLSQTLTRNPTPP